MSVPIVIFGGELHGTVVDRNEIQVMASRGPSPLYDPSGGTRPFSDDYVTRTLVAERMGITVPVIVDGVPSSEVLDTLTRAVRETFIRIIQERPRDV